MIYTAQLIEAIKLKRSANKFLWALCFMLFIAGSGGRVMGQSLESQNDDIYVQVNNQKALRLLYQAQPDQSMILLDSILKKKENAESYYLLAHIYNSEENWEKGIEYAKKAIQLNPDILEEYVELFNGYAGAEKWKDALSVSDRAIKADVNGTESVAKNIQVVERASRFEKISHTLFPFFFILIIAVFFLPMYRAFKRAVNYFHANGTYRFSEVFLLSVGVSCTIRFVFYLLSPWIWSLNPHINTIDYAPPRYIFIYEHDGIESFSFYVLMLVNIFITLLVLPWVLKLKEKKNAYIVVFSALIIVCGYYLYSIGFLPPMPDNETDGESQYPFVMIVLGIVSIGLYNLYLLYPRITKWILIVMITFVGFAGLYPTSILDLGYVLAPALRLYHGFGINETYFQYDLYLSFVALAFMKLNIDLSWVPYFAQVSFFFLFIGAFLFSDKFFKTKGLSVFFILSLVLVRFYSIYDPYSVIFQISPARLDLWIIPLLIAYKKGVRHWLVGLSLGLLLIFHRNLGVIYSTAYIELLATLFLLAVVDLIQEKKLTRQSLGSLFKTHLRLGIVSVAFIISAVALCYILFGGIVSKSAILYTKLGIGMLRISPTSFYWYVPVILASLAVYLVYKKNKLGERYASIGLFIILLTIGNSMYFFGRSHEHAVLCISASLVLSLFVLLDVLVFTAPADPEIATAAINTEPTKKNTTAKNKKIQESAKRVYFTQRKVITYLPVFLILGVGYFYSERIVGKVSAECTNFTESRYNFPLQSLMPPIDTTAIRKVVHNSPKVFFLDPTSFYFYYYGGYAPQGYFNPTATYVYKKDLVTEMQGLLNKGYYIVYDDRKFGSYSEYFPLLNYNHTGQEGNYISLRLDSIKPLLPADKATLFHMEAADSLVKQGMDYSGLDIKGDFTVEVVVKPLAGMQVPNAGIINNLTQFPHEGLKGMAFQLDNAVQNQYILAFSNGTPAIPNVVITMESNSWHYITATVNKESMKVYDNGKLMGTAAFAGQPFVNSDLPITIGNRNSRDSHFKGYIREVRISSGNPSEAEIISTGQRLDAELNNKTQPPAGITQ